jgi:hypothetical protein
MLVCSDTQPAGALRHYGLNDDVHVSVVAHWGLCMVASAFIGSQSRTGNTSRDAREESNCSHETRDPDRQACRKFSTGASVADAGWATTTWLQKGSLKCLEAIGINSCRFALALAASGGCCRVPIGRSWAGLSNAPTCSSLAYRHAPTDVDPEEKFNACVFRAGWPPCASVGWGTIITVKDQIPPSVASRDNHGSPTGLLLVARCETLVQGQRIPLPRS